MSRSVMESSSTAVKARYKAILNAATDGVVVIDLSGRIEEFNPAAAMLFGYSVEEVIGQNVSMLMDAPYKANHDDYIRRYRETGEAQIVGIGREVEARRKDGSRFPIHLSVGEVEIDGLRGFVGLIRDISQRRQLEAELTQRREELHLTLDRAPMAIASCDLDGTIRSANAACCRLFEASEAVLEGSNLLARICPGDRVRFQSACSALASGATEDMMLRLQMSSCSQSLIHADVFLAVMRDPNLKPTALLAELINRTTEVKAANEAAEQREQLARVGRLGIMGEMATGIAHEINQPLTAVANYAQAAQRLLDMQPMPKEKLHDVLDKVRLQAERAGNVISRIRRFTRPEPVEAGNITPAELLNDVRMLVEMDLRRFELELKLNVAPDLGRIRADAIQLQQVLINLIRNAADAMRESQPEKNRGDSIILSADARGQDWLALHVDDDGPGLDGDSESRLFEPFFSSKPDGFGLGLSICKSIVDAHGGEIQHAPSPVLSGARFTVLLPCSEPNRA